VSWLDVGSLLGVGTAVRNMHLYDVRLRGTNSPPISVAAHFDEVSGIVPDPSRPKILATFSSSISSEQEDAPVKLWDLRKMDSPMVEIRFGNERAQVSALEWNTYCPGMLCAAVGERICFYDTLGAARGQHVSHAIQARPVLSRIVNVENGPVVGTKEALERSRRADIVQSLTFPVPLPDIEVGKAHPHNELYPKRMFVVSGNGQVLGMPTNLLAPLQISPRDGRIVHSGGRTSVCMTPTNDEGPTALENARVLANEDISVTMMRRARCFHTVRYSTDPNANQLMLKGEESQLSAKYETFRSNSERLRRVWGWIERIETLSDDQTNDDFHTEGMLWPAKGLADAGVYKLLRLDISDDKLVSGASTSKTGRTRLTKQQRYFSQDTEQKDSALGCKFFDSPLRR
jgi:hypothetical protein